MGSTSDAIREIMEKLGKIEGALELHMKAEEALLERIEHGLVSRSERGIVRWVVTGLCGLLTAAGAMLIAHERQISINTQGLREIREAHDRIETKIDSMSRFQRRAK